MDGEPAERHAARVRQPVPVEPAGLVEQPAEPEVPGLAVQPAGLAPDASDWDPGSNSRDRCAISKLRRFRHSRKRFDRGLVHSAKLRAHRHDHSARSVLGLLKRWTAASISTVPAGSPAPAQDGRHQQIAVERSDFVERRRGIFL